MVNLDDSSQFSQLVISEKKTVPRRKETMLPSLARQNSNLDLFAKKVESGRRLTALERPNNGKLSDPAPDFEFMPFEKSELVQQVRKNSGYFGMKKLEPERDSPPIKRNNLDASRFIESESDVVREDWLTDNF